MPRKPTGRPPGRPPKWTDPEKMQAAIDKYFVDCEGELLRKPDGSPLQDKWGAPIYINKRPPTVSGLALALGLSSRQSLLEYQAKDAFGDAISRAKRRVESYAESRLYDKDGARGAEFVLRCNFGWSPPAPQAPAQEQQSGVAVIPAREAGDD